MNSTPINPSNSTLNDPYDLLKNVPDEHLAEFHPHSTRETVVDAFHTEAGTSVIVTAMADTSFKAAMLRRYTWNTRNDEWRLYKDFLVERAFYARVLAVMYGHE